MRTFKIISIGLILAAAAVFTITACNEKLDPAPSAQEEFVMVDGVKHLVARKKMASNNSAKIMEVYFNETLYPFLSLEQPYNPSTGEIEVGEYVQEGAPLYDTLFGDYYVSFWYAEDANPIGCQWRPDDKLTSTFGKYELKLVNGKYVSEFGDTHHACMAGGNGTDTRTLSGYIIWEEKD